LLTEGRAREARLPYACCMGFWKGLVDKATQKKEELEEEAKKRAAKKAAEMALDTGKAVARSAVKNAGKTFDYAGKKLGEAIFGPMGDEEAVPFSTKAAPDPFAKVKADEAARKLATQKEKAVAKEREQERAKTEREVDDELAALKKKIRGQ
jgi:hypothetical protein